MNTQTTKHTPGPWKVEPAYTGTSRFPISHPIDSIAAGILAEVNGQGGTEQDNTANARLIAAAPELLEALKNTAEQLAAWFEMADPEDVNGNDKAILANARAAIAKASQ